jgi:hypothetical protein
MNFFRRRMGPDSNNQLVGLFLLVLLAVFIGPNVTPRLINSIAPTLDETIPCDWLRQSENLAYHQSLIGRAASSPIQLQTRAHTYVDSATQQTMLSINIVVINNSLGTVPFVYNPNQIMIGDNGSSGLGVLFNTGNVANTVARQDSGSFPESNIRLLNPRQRCIHRVQIFTNQAPGATEVRSYYRINTAGTTVQTNPMATPIFRDQGLAVVPNGYVESPPVSIPITAQ